jgi:hypothetical protein
MTIVLINYANERWKQKQRLNTQSGYAIGQFDQVISYSPTDIDREFVAKNELILSCDRGNGYWLWKPYFIVQTLRRIGQGDILFYCDSGAQFVHAIQPLSECARRCDQAVMTFELPFSEKQYTKRDALALMDCDSKPYTNTPQRLASFSLWQKTTFSLRFASEWLKLAKNPILLMDADNLFGKDNYPDFIEHRHDQSIFSLLAKKYGLKPFRDPSQWGNNHLENYPESTYPQIVNHTR